eukprot:gene25349-31795_t
MRTKKITLQADLKWTSFTFGPDMDWMKFTIFVLNNRGEVFAVCPIIPDGTLVSRQVVNELWSWVEGQANNSRTESSRPYVETIKVYLLQTLGPPSNASSNGYDVVEDSSPTAASGSGLFVRAGEVQSGSDPEFALQSFDSVQSPFMDGISGNSIVVQGPLVAERGPDAVRRTTAANDICVPIVDSSETSGAAAPVLVVAFDSGEVDFHLIDAEDSSSGYVGPAWRPIDRHRALLATTLPSLLLVETIAVQQLESAAEGTKDQWKLLPDPVMSHYIHVTNFARSQSYLLSSAWLRTALENMSSGSEAGQYQGDDSNSILSYSVNGVGGGGGGRGRNGDLFGSEYKESAPRLDQDDTADEEEEEEVSYCIPVFVVTADSATVSSDSQSASREQKSSEASFPSNVSLNGMAVLSDPLVGHVAIFRTSSGLVSAVNLTVHSKLCELQTTLSNIVTETDQLSSIKQQLTHATSEEGLRWRHSQQLVLRIATGLKNMPVIESKTTDNKKILIEAAQNLERDVVLPMNELSQSTLFHFDILQETLRSQVQILEGPADATAGAKKGDEVSLNTGLKNLIANLATEHEALVQRVERITEKMHQQKENAEMHLSLAMNQRSKLTRAEVLYKQQLRDWSATIAQMSAQIDTLRLLAKPAVRITPTASESSNVLSGTPLKGQSGPAGLYSPSPIGAQGYTPVSGYRSQQTPSRYGVTSSGFNSAFPPQTPEPSSPSSRFTGGSAASYTTPRPPLKSVTEQQQSSTQSFQSPGYNTKFLTMQSPAAFRRPTTAGQPAQMPSQTPQKAQPLVLNQDDQTACRELLGAQTDLLSEAEDKLRGLEERLKAVILSRN